MHKHSFSVIQMKIINKAFFYLFFGYGDPLIDLWACHVSINFDQLQRLEFAFYKEEGKS